jgi:peptidoglycan/LPS O-acetylase OafA/YrhL
MNTGSALGADRNNFDLLRLSFAVAVAAYHLPLLAGWDTSLTQPDGALSVAAEIAVQGFFVISGYLVYASLRRSSLRTYAEKRVRVVVVCALAAVAFEPAARADLAGVATYLGWNLALLNFMAPTLPGVFAENAITAVNGALWTIKIEVMFYIILPALVWMLDRAGKARWWVVGAVYIGAEAWRAGFAAAGHPSLAVQLPGQMSFFVVGVALEMVRNRVRLAPMVPLAGAAFIAGSILTPALEPLRAAGLGALVIWLARGAPFMLDAARFGDLSYGIYIVHFPIIQTMIALKLFPGQPVVFGLAAAVLIVAAALVLWRVVEQPMLRPDSPYRHRTSKSGRTDFAPEATRDRTV